jgi:hypothetical protein
MAPTANVEMPAAPAMIAPYTSTLRRETCAVIIAETS